MASLYSPDSTEDMDQEMAKISAADNLTADALRQTRSRAAPSKYHDAYPGRQLHKISGVRLPDKPPTTLWDISLFDGKVTGIETHDPEVCRECTPPGVLDGLNRLLAPSLCHAHVHLDKCFLLQDPKFSDLQIENGDFQEAMELTGKAKSRFEEDDLLRRGRQLVEESIRHGVTAMRAFVEVDGGVYFKCLDAGLKLQEEFKDQCEIQICAFAQLALFSGDDKGEEIRRLMAEAARRNGVDVVGSTPYVEQDQSRMKENIRWISALALTCGKHLDLHLDYFLDESKQPLVWSVLDIVRDQSWNEMTDKLITLGHCTRLTRFRDEDWRRLRHDIGSLPVSFVGLPTSDLFMMRTAEKVRGTLPVVEMIEKHGINAALAVNNVGNAFTPHGNCDPLSIASLGVGLYQAGTKRAAEVLYQTVSSRAKEAIGCQSNSLSLAIGEPADFILFDRMETGWRCRKSIVEVVYDAGSVRITVRNGRVTAA
ncbi:cytosine deaminase protein-like protein [Lojkania enalia]|uniref:Cytosine deaminase protein-like protein n=1 Tax=Lojkania enalia TaxID=147567 RepID=A0A9P4MY41_9PLEO|nr:cytosine deaminase protein-like protein [Didymosphaeria enalia]